MLTRNRTYPSSPFGLLSETLTGSFPRGWCGDACRPVVVTAPFGSAEQGGATPTMRLALDITEKDNVIELKASLPGFQKEEVQVHVDRGVLTITAEHAESSECDRPDEGVTWYRKERRSINLSRSIRLPEGLVGDNVTAELKDGVLSVRIPNPPKKEAVSGRKINVS